jgi:penicillin-insensitive murein endopeptidase
MIGRVVLLFALTAMWAGSSFAESVCFGTTSNGRLENGVRLPDSGSNFKSYGLFPELARRTYVHSVVREIVIESYQLLERELPTRVFKYAETGYKNGGQFKPHKTHQNGLSIDFMVPVQNEAGNRFIYPLTHSISMGTRLSLISEERVGNTKSTLMRWAHTLSRCTKWRERIR